LTIDRSTLFQAFKYIVYFFLAMNIYWFFAEEHLAAKIQFPNGVGLDLMIEAYAATIDTVAWVVLLLMFELETYVLEDEQFSRTVTWSLHGLRAICYAFIVYAFYGYVANLLTLDGITPLANLRDLCALAGQWSYATTLDEFTTITTANCNSFSTATSFLRFDDMQAVVDLQGRKDIIALAWVDVINSAVWLLVVIVLEIDMKVLFFMPVTSSSSCSMACYFLRQSIGGSRATLWTFGTPFCGWWRSSSSSSMFSNGARNHMSRLRRPLDTRARPRVSDPRSLAQPGRCPGPSGA